MKICSKYCNTKHESEFRINKNCKSGLRSQCRVCDSTYNKVYRQTPRGKKSSLDGALRYTRTPHGKLKRQLYEQSLQGRLARKRSTIRRRERKKNVDIWLTNSDINIIYSNFNHQCFNCHSVHNLEIDHHYPLFRGYGLSLKNAVLLCRSCNASKGRKMPEEFYTVEKLEELRGKLPQ